MAGVRIGSRLRPDEDELRSIGRVVARDVAPAELAGRWAHWAEVRSGPSPVHCDYAQGGGSVSIRNGLPAGTTKVAYTTAFSVLLSLLTMKGAVPLSTNVSCGPYVLV